MPQQAPIKFVVVPQKSAQKNELNTFYLVRDNWDDYGFMTSFFIYFVNQSGEEKSLGSVKITYKGFTAGFVMLPADSFSQLPNNYCSLGNQGYYEELMGLLDKEREAILIGLRDCAYQQNIFEEFSNEESFKTSLLRYITVDNVAKLFRTTLDGNVILTPYEFLVRINADDSTKIDVKVTPYSSPPSNIHVLIGRNGVGKTRILSGLAESIAHSVSPNNISQTVDVDFHGKSEWFTNLITIAFSPFDHFKPISSIKGSSKIQKCHYIGLKNDDGNSFKKLIDLQSDFVESIRICLNSVRKKRWIEAIEILNSDPIFESYKLQNFTGDDSSLLKLREIFSLLSSGHKIILLIITKLVELVDEKTLVLIDELENHLHPPLLSSCVRAISDLLIKRNAVAIIATHSPVVLQEVPKFCITIIERVGSQYSLFKPEQETYGENIGTLTREVFRLEVETSGFYKTIREFLNKEEDFDKLMDHFDGNIGSAGRAIARSIIATTDRNDDA